MTENRSGNSPLTAQRHQRAAANRMQLAISRVCHDLVSPLGAIANGIELLLLSGQSGSPEMDLIDASAATTLARLRFFRIAYGMAEQDKSVSAKELRAMFATLSQNGRVRIDWQVPQQVPATEVQAVCLAIQCLESALPYSGDIRITQTDGRWDIHAQAPRIKADPAMWTPLMKGAAPIDVTAAVLQFALLPEAVQSLERKIHVDIGEQHIDMAF